MSGKIIVTVELKDGTCTTQVADWTGDNPAFEAREAHEAGTSALAFARKAIAATHGDIDKKED